MSASSHLHHVQQPPIRLGRYYSPVTLQEAIEAMAEHKARARPVAGGTDLLVELDRGVGDGADVLVDLTRIPGLDSIEESEGRINLGPLVTHAAVAASPVCVERALPLAQACIEVGSPQLRNRATVVGNLVTASPANDTISSLLAMEADVTVASVRGRRDVPLVEFITGFRSTLLAPDELVVGVSFPALGGHRRGVFVKLGNRRAQAISVCHLAVVIEASGTSLTSMRVALGSVAPTVVLVGGLDEVEGSRLDAATIDRVVERVEATATPIGDVRASADYRSATIGVMARRALQTLADGDEASSWPANAPRLDTNRLSDAGTTVSLEGTGSFERTGSFEGTVSSASPVSLARGAAVTATVNGASVTAAATGTTLLEWLRDDLGLTGTKEGCAEGECGACTVHLDGKAVMSCLVPAGRAEGADVVTVEGLGSAGALHPVQQSFIDCAAVQCGFCTPGLLMSSALLLAEHPEPTAEQVAAGLAGNLCRCTGYYSIHQAVQAAAASTEAQP